MSDYFERQEMAKQDLDRVIKERAEEGYPWVSKGYWNAGLPAIEGLTPGKIIEFCHGYAISMSRLCADRIMAETRRLIPEAILITTDEPETSYDDEAGCDVLMGGTAHVQRDGEWVELEDHWEAAHPGLAQDVRDCINQWADLTGAACVTEEAELIWTPIDEKGEERAVQAAEVAS